jgi:TetR/AcrR family transcriptional regulator, tetracycline repressor protein
VPALPGG